MKQNQAALSASTQTFRQEVQTEVASVRSDLSNFSAEIERQMRLNTEAMHQARQLQQDQMNAGFNELKALLQAPKNPRGPKRDSKQAAEESGGMNDL